MIYSFPGNTYILAASREKNWRFRPFKTRGGCSVTETGRRLSISEIETGGFIVSKQQKELKALIRACAN